VDFEELRPVEAEVAERYFSQREQEDLRIGGGRMARRIL